ncbi:MAG: ABC transporter ATP-binding protein [Rhodospirillales bacterium]|nr:ABC transporter ATP-binding protein [Rhodospirillales bacterium]
MPILSLHDVSKSFGSLVVIDRLSLHLNEGEALGIIGPNGAGKTTLFNLITGDQKADSGRIEFQGREFGGQSVHARCRGGIGRTYQIPHPFAKMTVFENLLVGAVYGNGQTERASYDSCVEILETTQLTAKANEPAGTLTLLERKRLELARALATKPKVLLLDEIGGGLSEQECRELIATIRTIHKSGVSLIWIEHIVHALMSVAERLVVINFGRKLDDGHPETVMNNPDVQEVYMGISAA